MPQDAMTRRLPPMSTLSSRLRHHRNPDPLPLLTRLPTDVTWAGVFAYLDLQDLLSVSMTCHHLLDAMHPTFWHVVLAQILGHPARDNDAVRRLRQPRRRIVRLMAKRMCAHCHRLQATNLRLTHRGRHHRFRVCAVCSSLPRFRDIQFTDAQAKYRLTRRQLMTLPSRTVRCGMGYRRLFYEQDVARLADEVTHDAS
ncbi:Aste57867_9774 [Aphanomyces stellatus]|uniref:Aste57867_9774 protein n=1 Tax=Aphanomyces stellatus TaxID=120398 RepID=A0A485KPD7_9STRA|nr:hypothetical protein As57867_009735 [Aphanomyces stellatus]VFT86653.1 Aste57867_9774 [Aphanomyces stellatus]